MPKNESRELAGVFTSLRGVLEKHASPLSVSEDTATKYCLDAAVGPATLESWGGQVRRARIPVAWVEMRKSYVSYHLMAVSIPSVQSGMSAALKTRMQGRACFNFTVNEPKIFNELDSLTAASIAAFRKAGFTA
jgi:hypothetical protein